MLGLALNLSDTNAAFHQEMLVKDRARDLWHSLVSIEKGFIFRFFIHPPLQPSLLLQIQTGYSGYKIACSRH